MEVQNYNTRPSVSKDSQWWSRATRDLCGGNRANVEAEQDGDRIDGERADRSSGRRGGDGQHHASYNVARDDARSAVLDEQQEMQQQMLMDIIKQQRAEMAKHREEMKDLLVRTETGAGKETMKVSLPKPTLQKLSSDETLNTLWKSLSVRPSSRVGRMMSGQCNWLLTGKAMAAYTNLSVESANNYPTIRQAIL